MDAWPDLKRFFNDALDARGCGCGARGKHAAG
jgi:hypothetical protein